MNYVVEKSDMDTLAKAIQAKGGTSEPLTFPDGMVQAVEAISGGGGTDWPILIDKTVYTHAEDWENDSLGNTQNFYDRYFKKDIPSNQIEFFRITENAPNKNPNYMAVCAFNWVSPSPYINAFARSANYAWRSRSTTSSYWIKPGAKVTRYLFDFGEVI